MGKTIAIVALVGATCVGCTTLEMPPVPEYHPAHALAPEGVMEPSFKVLSIEPELPPNLPVPEGEQQPPPKMKMESGGGMGDGEQKKDGATPEHSGAAWGDELDKPLHGQVDRPGMQDAMPEGGEGPEGLEVPEMSVEKRSYYQERIDDDIKRGEAQMDPVVVPSEQRGMHTAESLYHKHQAKYSTQIVHPRRVTQEEDVVGPQVWLCPRHPRVAVRTPGGRCPTCETILVPVKVADAEAARYE